MIGRADLDQKHDLVIHGGQVLDPSQNLAAVRDVGIRNASVCALAPVIPEEQARLNIDARGKLVIPGIVDLHAHVFPLGTSLGLPADELIPFSAATTVVSAGDAGVNNFGALKHHVMPSVRTRMFAFLHISGIGLTGYPVGELRDLGHVDIDAIARTMAENPEVLIGVKVRQSQSIVGENGLEPLKLAIRAAELSGPRVPVMCHIGKTPGPLSDLLDLLRPGDILTHCFSGSGNNIVQDGKVIPAAFEAKKRGVLFDVGHGAGSFDYAVAETAFDQGVFPDTISSDIHVVSANTPGKPYMPWVMSKLLNMGFSLEQVITLSTAAPARIIGRLAKLGTLQIGAPGDVSILELVEGPVDFVDTRNNRRRGDRYLKPIQAVIAGRPFGRPYPFPFTYS